MFSGVAHLDVDFVMVGVDQLPAVRLASCLRSPRSKLGHRAARFSLSALSTGA
jgi:hypothetical protein